MGDCASRPKPEDEKTHISRQNHTNDSKFTHMLSFPILNSYNDGPIKTADDLDEAKTQINYLEKQIPILESKLSELLSGKTTNTQKLIIEVQKGKDIIPPVPCIYDPCPYVKIELSPVKIAYRTGISKKFIPCWYELFEHKSGLDNIDKIIVKIFFQTQFSADVLFGTTEIEFEKLKNQELVDEWFKITPITQTEGSPEIKIRLQAIISENVVNKKKIDQYNEVLKAAKEMRKNVYDKVKKCLDELGPEAGG